MLAIVGAIEWCIARQPVRFLETATLSWRLAVEAIPLEAKRCEVACLGDSLVKIGVISGLVHEGSGLSTYNFAMAQAPAPATYFALRRLIEAGGKPSALVIDFKPSLLAGGPKFSVRHWQAVLTPGEAFDLAIESKSPGMFIEIGLGRILPSYRDRNQIREAIVAFVRGQPAPTDETNRLALRHWGMNQGSHLNPPQSPFTGEVSPEIHRKMLSDEWKPHRINVSYVDRLLTLADSKRIPVYWLIPPLTPELQERREKSGVDASFVAFVRSMQSKHPQVTVVDGRRSGYDASTFADHTHLNGRGAVALSHDLADLIKYTQVNNRWVNLPRFREGTSTLPLEDIEETRIAMKREADRPERSTR
jgi:hypothetical protein